MNAPAVEPVEQGRRAGILGDPRASFRAVMEAVRLGDMCRRCGLTRALVAMPTVGFKIEKPHPDHHCACPASETEPAGPAYFRGDGV